MLRCTTYGSVVSSLENVGQPLCNVVTTLQKSCPTCGKFKKKSVTGGPDILWLIGTRNCQFENVIHAWQVAFKISAILCWSQSFCISYRSIVNNGLGWVMWIVELTVTSSCKTMTLNLYHTLQSRYHGIGTDALTTQGAMASVTISTDLVRIPWNITVAALAGSNILGTAGKLNPGIKCIS